MSAMSRHQLRAARALLRLRQEPLADLAEIGVATLRRFENGTDVSPAAVQALRKALEDEGAVFVAPGTLIDGVAVGAGVTLLSDAELPAGTTSRLAALDMTPEQAAAARPSGKGDRVGKRARVPYVPSQQKPHRRLPSHADSGDDQASRCSPPKQRT